MDVIAWKVPVHAVGLETDVVYPSAGTGGSLEVDVALAGTDIVCESETPQVHVAEACGYVERIVVGTDGTGALYVEIESLVRAVETEGEIAAVVKNDIGRYVG